MQLDQVVVHGACLKALQRCLRKGKKVQGARRSPTKPLVLLDLLGGEALGFVDMQQTLDERSQMRLDIVGNLVDTSTNRLKQLVDIICFERQSAGDEIV